MNNKNILWINILKAICIISVFWGHSVCYYGISMPLNRFIAPFFVNAFFFVSGYLLFRKQLSEPLVGQNVDEFAKDGYKILTLNILYRIIIPSVLFSAIEFIPSFALRGRAFGIEDFLFKTIGGCTYWFTAALAVAELIIGLMLLTRRKSIWFYAICCSALSGIGWLICRDGFSFFTAYPSFPWQYKEGLLCLVFMAAGGLYWRYEAVIDKVMNNYVLCLMIAVYVTLLSLWPKSFKVLISVQDLNLAGIGVSLLATLILIELCKMIRKCDLLNYIGQNTIGFYFMSGALPIVLSMAVKHFHPGTNFIGFALVFAGSVVISYFAVRIINRYLPWMLDMRKIKRTPAQTKVL